MTAETIVNRDDLRSSPLSVRHKIGYSSGQVLDGVVSYSLQLFLLFYLTTVCGIPGGLAGSALAIGLVVDAFMDPLIGSLSDSWRSKRFGRRLPFMAVGMPATVIFFIGIFSLPEGLSQPLLFVWLCILSVLLRVSISLYLLPYMAVGAELSESYQERSSIMAWRWGVGMMGALAAVVLGFGVFFAGHNGLSVRSAYTPFAASLSILVLAAGAIAMRTIWLSRHREHAPTPSTGGAFLPRFFSEMGELYRNHSFRVLFITSVLFFTAIGVHLSLALHANTYLWRLTPAQIQAVTLCGFAALVIGAPLAGPALKHMEKKTLAIIGVAGLGLADSVPAALWLLGLFPFQGTELALALGTFAFSGSVLIAGAAIALSSMMADAVDEHELIFGARREALYFAGSAFAGKAASGLGALLSGLILQIVHFPSNISEHGGAAAILGPDILRHLALFYGPGAGVLYLLAVITICFYRLNAERYDIIRTKLRERERMGAQLDAAR